MPAPHRVVEAGTTIQLTWVGSTAPSSLSLAITDPGGTLVCSAAAVQSGGGYWYCFATIPDSYSQYPVTLLATWTATASTQAGSASPFINRMLFDVKKTTAFGASGL
jgi:hypothetical protein